MAYLLGLMIGVALYLGKLDFQAAYSDLANKGGKFSLLLLVALFGLVLHATLMIGIFQTQYILEVREITFGVAIGAFCFGLGMRLSKGCLLAAATPSLGTVITIIAFALSAWFFQHQVSQYGINITAFSSAVVDKHNLLVGFEASAALLITMLVVRGVPSTNGIAIAGVIAMMIFLMVPATDAPWRFTAGFSYFGGWMVSEHQTSGFFSNTVWNTDMAIFAGIILAAILQGKFNLSIGNYKMLPLNAVGGICMGFGISVSGGCNVGGMLVPIMTGSLSGWVWLMFAILGFYISKIFEISTSQEDQNIESAETSRTR